MSLGRSAIAAEAIGGGGDGAGVLVKKPPPKRTLIAIADRTIAPEPR